MARGRGESNCETWKQSKRGRLPPGPPLTDAFALRPVAASILLCDRVQHLMFRPCMFPNSLARWYNKHPLTRTQPPPPMPTPGSKHQGPVSSRPKSPRFRSGAVSHARPFSRPGRRASAAGAIFLKPARLLLRAAASRPSVSRITFLLGPPPPSTKRNARCDAVPGEGVVSRPSQPALPKPKAGVTRP